MKIVLLAAAVLVSGCASAPGAKNQTAENNEVCALGIGPATGGNQSAYFPGGRDAKNVSAANCRFNEESVRYAEREVRMRANQSDPH